MELNDSKLKELFAQALDAMPNPQFENRLMERYYREQEKRVQQFHLMLSAMFFLISLGFGFYLTIHFDQVNHLLFHLPGGYTKGIFTFCFVLIFVFQADNWATLYRRYIRHRPLRFT